MDNKSVSLQTALSKAAKGKAAVHKVPAKKEGKGLASYESSYYPPTLYLSDKDFPGIEKFSVGQKIQLAVTAEVTGLSTRENGGKKEMNCDLKLTEISDITPAKEGNG
jgi:hypothetical protein